jgi:integrase
MCPINLQYHYNSRSRNVPIGLKVHHNEWSNDAGSPTNRCENREKILEKIAECSTIVQKIIDDRIENGDSLAVEDVKPEIVSKLNKPKTVKPTRPSVESAFEMYLAYRRNTLKASTIQTYRTTMDFHLKPFCEDAHKELTWALFDEDFGENWKDHFIKNSIQNTTAGKNFRRLHTFLDWASNKGYLTTNYYRKWVKIKEKYNDPVVCSEDDLLKFEEFSADKSKSPLLRQVTDYFLFLCYTGLRVGDFQDLCYRNLSHEDAGKGTESEKYQLKLFSEKTGVNIKIPLIDEALNLIMKYNDDLSNTFSLYFNESDVKTKIKTSMVYRINPVINQNPNHRLFPKIFEQDINDNIKKVAKECGLDTSFERVKRIGKGVDKDFQPKYELISCHTGRRTFITLALQSGIQVPTIMKYTGHTSYGSIARYFAISEEFLHEQMEQFGARGISAPVTKLRNSFKRAFY